MMRASTMRVVATLFASLYTLPAAEIIRRDAQFSLGTTPTDFDYTIDTPGGSFAGSDAFDYGWQARLGGRWTLTKPGWSLAPVIGGDLLYATSHGAGGELSCLGVSATGGIAWAINELWSTDLELALSYQRADLSLDDSSGLSGNGNLIGTDMRVRVLRLLDRRWSLGAELGWGRASGSISANQERDIDWEQGGFSVGLLITWRLSMRPAALE